jgi:hypothetical protein
VAPEGGPSLISAAPMDPALTAPACTASAPKLPYFTFGAFKGTVSRDFRPSVFRQSITPRPLINTLKYFRFLFQIRRAITEYVFVQRYAA